MKIFGLQFGAQSPRVDTAIKEIVKDQIPDIKVLTPVSKKPALIPVVKDPTLNYNSTRSLGRGAFHPSEYDLSEIGVIEDVDSYVMQAFEKKLALMFKEGWDLLGPNLKTIKYIRARFEQIATASKTPTPELFRSIGSGIIKKSNAFIVKVRNTEASGGRIRSEPGKQTEIKPVAAYFIAPAETMEYEMSGNRITSWRQCMPNGDIKEYAPKDVIHIFHNRKDGFVFGTPSMIPVIDDIRALRKIEENIELLVYQHLFPLFQYKVGTDDAPAGYTETGEREIDIVRREIQFMPTEGGIVTPERHEIRAIGAEGRAIRAEGYLEYFKKRVFAGLGLSGVDYGEGSSANRSTSESMSRNLIDGVKNLQQVIEIAINEFMIKELLLESTFGDDVLAEENLVRLKFKEIDQDAKVKKENHAADLFAKDMISHDESRRALGLEPMKLPTPEDVRERNDDPAQFPEWNRMRWKLFEEPKLLIASSDEQYLPGLMAAARSPSTSITQEDIQVTLEQRKAEQKAEQQAKSTQVKARDSLRETYLQIKEDTIDNINKRQKLDLSWLSSLIRTQMTPEVNKLISEQLLHFRRGYLKQKGKVNTEEFIKAVATIRVFLRDQAESYINKLTENTISLLKKKTSAINTELTQEERIKEAILVTDAVFSSLEFRASWISETENARASFYGEAVALSNGGANNIKYVINSDACSICSSKIEDIISLKNGQLTVSIMLSDMPPHHPGCQCSIEVVD